MRRVAPFCTAQVLDADLDGALASESGEALVPTLDQVQGDACYPGSVSITWRGETAAGFAVTREGEQDARYSGSLSRTT